MRLFLLSICLLLYCLSNAQTVTFKPGSTIGKDAYIFTTGNCNPSQYPAPPQELNFGDDPEIGYLTWTYNYQGCSQGTHRTFIRFDELNTLPTGVTVTNATLNLFGVSSSQLLPSDGNSYYPSSPLSSNTGWVKRVTGSWNEDTVTWNNQPSTTNTNQMEIPQSTEQWNWDTSIDVTNIVQDVLASGNNYGFMLKLQNESTYRSTLFASSDNADTIRWPELEITYCDSRFTYSSSSNNPYSYDFSSVSGDAGDWLINDDSNIVASGSGSNFHYIFRPGTYRVCFRKGKMHHMLQQKERKENCSTCINICIPRNGVIRDTLITPETKDLNKGKRPIQATKSISGDTNMMIPRNVSVGPNPTQNRWKVDLQTIEDGEVSVVLFDLQGKKIKAYTKDVKVGENSFYQDAGDLSSGAYILQLKKGQFTVRKNLLKK